MDSLKLENIYKSFGSVEVLKDINLEVDNGEFIIIVGPSGCGKSTLLRMISGLDDPTSGNIMIDGKSVNHSPPAKRGIAMVFQSYALYPHLTVQGNMSLGLKQAKRTPDVIKKRVDMAAKMLTLEDYMDRRPAELSGGQRQRVAIGRAIVRKPKLFLFDEPLSNLDASLRVNTRLEIARLHHELNATIIYVTHDQIEAMTLASRIVILNKGKIEQIGSPIDLYNNPDNIFVAGFVGSPQMNFIEAAALGIDKIKTIGIRPEHISVSRTSGDLKGKIVHIEHLGCDTNIYIDNEKTGSITIRLFGEHDYCFGDAVYVRFQPERIFHFDDHGKTINHNKYL